jgi:citrate lyase subunit gamma (acyl carrier protein)
LRIITEAVAGTLESSDLLVKVSPSREKTLEIHVTSDVMKQFGTQIRRVVDDTLQGLAVTDGLIVIEDKGALDYAIRARVQAAVLRGAASKELNWEQLS